MESVPPRQNLSRRANRGQTHRSQVGLPPDSSGVAEQRGGLKSPRQCHGSRRRLPARSFPRRGGAGRTDRRVASAGIVAESDPSRAESDPESLRGWGAESDTDVDTVSHQRAVAQAGASRFSRLTPYSPTVERRDSVSSGHLPFRRRPAPAIPARRTTGRGDRATRCRTGVSDDDDVVLVPTGSVNRAGHRRRRRRPLLGCVGPTPGSSRNGSAGRTPTASSYCLPPTPEASRRARPDWRPADPDRCRRRTRSDRPAARAPSITSSTYSLAGEPAEGVAPIAGRMSPRRDPRCSSPTAAGSSSSTRSRSHDRASKAEPRKTRCSAGTR